MKNFFYPLLLLLLVSITGQAQTLTVQGNVSNGLLGGVPNQLVDFQIHLSPANVLYDSTFTDSLGNFQMNYTLMPSQGPGVVIATTYCGGVAITTMDSFYAPNYTTNHLFNCTGGSNPGPVNIWLNGQVGPTALGDSILMSLYRVSLVGPILDTSFYVVDTMNMGYMYYGFLTHNPSGYLISASSNNSAYYTTYYGNTTLQFQATFINAMSPGSINGLNIQLQTSPSVVPTILTGSISGYIPNPMGLDSLQAILIEVQNNIWTPIDTMVYIDSMGLGQYYFSTTNSGPYAILARLLGPNAGSYAPTYHDNVTTWTASTPFSGNPGSNTIVTNITLQAAAGTGSGSGSAGGGVFNGLPFTGSVGMAGMPVYLQDASGNLLEVFYSRTDGSYNFSDLPFGDYALRVELFGVPSTLFPFTLNASNPNLQIDFTLGTNGIAASLEEAELALLGTYPNPANDWVRLQLKAKHGQNQTIRLLDMQGRIMLEKKVALEAGLQEVELSLEAFSKGMYLLEISGGQKSVHRLVIQ